MSRSGAQNDAQRRAKGLVHPVYLDVPMMVSFLAALKDGVEFENTVTRRDARTTSKDREAAGKVRLPPLASLFGLEASGKVSRGSGEEASEEVQVVRQHTAASLFNALHGALIEEEMLRVVASAADVEGLEPGDVVEIAGDFVGNPLEPVLGFFRQATPYFELIREPDGLDGIDLVSLRAEVAETEARATELHERAQSAQRSRNPAMKSQAGALREQAKEAKALAVRGHEVLRGAAERTEQDRGLEMFRLIANDLDKTPVHDTVLQANDLRAVLTMSSEFFTEVTRAHLRAGVFRTVGKVTRILGEDEEINLLRRTVIGAAETDIGRDMLRSAVEEGKLNVETFDPIIRAPAIQVLPVAVFV